MPFGRALNVDFCQHPTYIDQGGSRGFVPSFSLHADISGIAFADSRLSAYNVGMRSTPASVADNFDAELDAAKGMSFEEIIGRLLAAVADIVNAPRIARLGGPGRMRRLLSVGMLFLILAIVRRIRQQAIIALSVIVDIAMMTLRHLSHPPGRWAGA